MSGCVQEKPPDTTSKQTQQTPVQTATVLQETSIEKISSELNMMKSKGWDRLVGQLGQPKATTLLWYHLKTSYDIDTKMVFGNPNKLNSAIAVMVSKGGESAFPKIRIKGEEYYIIDPKTPAIAGEFKYGDMFDDPGGSNNFLSSNFRLQQEDLDKIKQWVRESGVTIRYSDFPVK
jgi:hypothetical protein